MAHLPKGQGVMPLPPFLGFLASNIPAVYDNTLSYYEELTALIKYLQDTVVPALNADSEAITVLSNYVEHYFDNLDVQEEINNKLDQMAEDGTLQEIITAYIQANTAWIFDTVADMKAATNLINGSYARTLGFRSLNDGGGATYYITDTGDADEMEVIATGDLFAHLVLPETVTPEMFGAYGDGVHDDTNAWNAAVGVKRGVKAFEKTYLTSKISVTDNITIDCGNAKFVCSGDTLFDIKGELVTSLANENNYTADDTDYSISNTDYLTYSGFAFVHGDNNFQESRDYYYGGFVCSFYKGKIEGSYPIPVTNTVIDIINPITATLKNIKDITHNTPTDTTQSIVVKYGVGCNLENIAIKKADSFIDIHVDKSIDVVMNRLNIEHESTVYGNVNYIVYVGDSSFTKVTNSYLRNKNWHAWTTSGNYLCYKNGVEDSQLFSSDQNALEDHDNALGTYVNNCTCACIMVSGLSVVKNCTIVNNKASSKKCYVRTIPVSIEKNAIYTIENNIFAPDSDVSYPYCGVMIYGSPVSVGHTYYTKQITIRDCRVANDVRCCLYAATSDTGGTYYIEKVVVDNCTMDISLKRNTETQIDISKNVLLVSNIDYDVNDGGTYRKSYVGINTSDSFGIVHITNCNLKNVIGVFASLNLNSVSTTSNISSAAVSGLLAGSNVNSRINTSVILAAGSVNIGSMIYGTNDKWCNIVSKSGVVYYQHIDNGAFTTAIVSA